MCVVASAWDGFRSLSNPPFLLTGVAWQAAPEIKFADGHRDPRWMDGLWLRPEVDFRWQEEVNARFENYIGALPTVFVAPAVCRKHAATFRKHFVKSRYHQYESITRPI